jgi:hypothetical protein
MGGTVTGFLARGRQNPRPQSGSQNRGLLAGMIGVEPEFEEALLPADDRGSTGLQHALNGVEGSSFCQHQDELGAKDVAGRQGTRLNDAASSERWLLVRDTSLSVAIYQLRSITTGNGYSATVHLDISLVRSQHPYISTTTSLQTCNAND